MTNAAYCLAQGWRSGKCIRNAQGQVYEITAIGRKVVVGVCRASGTMPVFNATESILDFDLRQFVGVEGTA